MQVVEVDVGDKKLRSGVQIEKCRYLETSGCTGLCVNSCKMPTQYFFTTELGYDLPLLQYIFLWRTLHFFEDHPATCKMCSSKCYMANMICRFAAHEDVTNNVWILLTECLWQWSPTLKIWVAGWYLDKDRLSLRMTRLLSNLVSVHAQPPAYLRKCVQSLDDRLLANVCYLHLEIPSSV